MLQFLFLFALGAQAAWNKNQDKVLDANETAISTVPTVEGNTIDLTSSAVTVDPSPTQEVAAASTEETTTAEAPATTTTEEAPVAVEGETPAAAVAAVETKDEPISGAPQKFVVLTTSRSGSTWLGSILQAHPQISFHLHECLADEDSLKTCINDWGVTPKLAEGTYTLKDTDVTTLLSGLFEKPTDMPWKTHVGFKWMTQQRIMKEDGNLEKVVSYLKDNNIKVIALRRENQLRKCASLYDMQQRTEAGEGVHKFAGDNSSWGSEKITVPADFYTWCLNWYDETERVLNKVSMHPDVNALHIFYTKLVQDKENQLERIHKFINVPMPIEEKEQHFQKIHSATTMSDIVENWEEIKAKIAETHHAPKLEKWEGADHL